MARLIWWLGWIVAIAIVWFFLKLPSHARDPDGKYADSPLKPWFEQLRSQRGLCCSFADGVTVQDVDYDADGQEDQINSVYRVRVTKDWPEEFQGYLGKYIAIPKSALIDKPNRAGVAIVWPYISAYAYPGTPPTGTLQIRCFIPGAGT